MNYFSTLSLLSRAAWRDFILARRELILCELTFKAVQAWLLVPAITMILAGVLAAAGYVAVSNLDIVAFLLTPLGVLYAGLFGGLALSVLLFEQASIMVLAALANGPERPGLRQRLATAAPQTWRVAQLAAWLVTLVALTFLPFLILAWITYRIFLSEQDIYFYLNVRPAAFWIAASIGGVLCALALAVALLLSVRWILALPIVLFENQSPRLALRASRQRVRGAAWQIGSILLGGHGGMLLVGLGVQAAFQLLAAKVLEHAGDRPTILILLLLAVQGGLVAAWSFVSAVGQSLLTRQIYLLQSAAVGIGNVVTDDLAIAAPRPIPPWNWRLAGLLIPVVLLLPLAAWWEISRYGALHAGVGVTAHRGHSRVAPENTLSAVRAAIASGTDYVEIDVQLTADGTAVLLHDRDLKRVAGDPRRIADVTWADVRQLDVGSWFAPAFATERISTLEEVIEVCRGRMKLNIEMKFYDADRRLVNEVVRVVRARHFESECLITSLNYDALQEVKRLSPGQRTGLIVAQALGNINRLAVDALMVRADFLSTTVIRSAHQRGQQVHVWTVNDPRQMAQQIKRGVNNLITSNPDVALQVREEWAGLTESERIVLAARLLLGLQP